MATFMGKLLLFLSVYVSEVKAQGDFGLKEPFPENIYPIEGTETKVTCVAFDSSGVKAPERIQFVRRDKFARYTNISASENVLFTERFESAVPPASNKLFVTMTIKNVTLNDDSTYGKLGRYECHAFAVGDPKEYKHGFSVNVILRDEIPVVTVPKLSVLRHGENTTLRCNLTKNEQVYTQTGLKRVSWYKDGVLLESIRNPDPDQPLGSLRPLVLNNNGITRSRDGGNYTCLLEVKLRNIRNYNVSDSTMVEIAPGFNKPVQVVNLTIIKGENASLKCAAQGFPLHVEWKYQKKGEDFVRPCIANDSDGKFFVHRNGIYDPYVLNITDVQSTDLGSYYCCLPSNCSDNVQENCQQFVLRELVIKKCDSKPSSSSFTLPWITAVSVEGAFLVAATAAIVMLVRKLRVKKTKEGSKVQTVESNYLEIQGISVTNPVQNNAIQLGGAENKTAPPCSKGSGYSVLNHPLMAPGDGSYELVVACQPV